VTAATEPGLTEVGVEAAAAVRDMLTRAVAGSPVAVYVEERPLAWDTLQQGGWDLLGASEDDGGGGATLRDLAEVGRAWGWAIVPAPLMPTIMAKRWSSAAREHDGPVTVGIRTRASGDRSVAPFAGEAGVRVLVDTDGAGTLADATEVEPDMYAPSLRLSECREVTAVPPEMAWELRTVWAAEASGCAARMLADAVAYAKERQQFGQPIGRFQAIKHQLANAHMLTEQAETAVILASQEVERAPAATRYAFDASLKVIEMAVQVHGGLGFTWEMGLHMYLRHVSALRELSLGLPA
jgi:alkylation response protein AidB-like acyl-CoA dehydrogenase